MSEQSELFDSGAQDEKKKSFSREQLTTTDGTSLDIAISSLIKELRRGNEWEALYWARELESRYYRYLWRRLLIFCAEDVGLANPDVTAQVVALREAYMITKEESARARGDYNFVAMAVYLLARSQKNKDVGFAHMIMHQFITRVGWKASPPDYAVDIHTKEGRQKFSDEKERGRHWFTEAQVVENRGGPMDYELWWARMQVSDGLWTRESVEAWARELDGLGLLEHGVEGPEFMLNPYMHIETGELVEVDDEDAIDMRQVTSLPEGRTNE